MNTLKIATYFNSESDKLALYQSDPESNCIEHNHEFDELVIVEQGHGLHVINGKPLFIQQGDVFLVRDHDYHFYDDLGTLKLTNILINPYRQFVFLNKIENILNRISASDLNSYIWLAPSLRKECNMVIDQLFNLKNPLEYREYLFFKLITIISQAHGQAQKNNTRYKLHLLLNHLQENCFEEYDWNNIAQRFHLTLRTMFRHIKEATGLTPENYIKRLRLLSARNKIRESDMTITEISLLCGFINSTHFSTLYKKAFGVTPREERRKTDNI
ncbi:helix-turn-helix domain-containing protein [uncultured Gilliamella sp.]|jgi:Transcriptional regulator containing an amidase domain and an AraC-type DNA-binding HTH domain|uniref:helix-turn-helix domain-containing protein n=1 Tax=uncultured Gilliamella sp. TaxID=1193505 RepID=UPI0025D901B2|nr:helix-turn-helix domain-containing protein [uncultured Gilliamella sp.]